MTTMYPTKTRQRTKLHKLLSDADLPQSFLVGELQTSKSHVSEWVNGERELPTRHMPTLCAIFKCGPDQLMGYVREGE